MVANEAKKKEILSTKEVAALLDVTTRTIQRMTKKGILISYLLNDKRYFKYSEILGTIEAGREMKKAA